MCFFFVQQVGGDGDCVGSGVWRAGARLRSLGTQGMARQLLLTIPCLYHTVPYNITPYRTMSYHTTLNHTIPYHTIPACIKHTTHPHINGHRLSRFSPIPNPLNKLPDHLILQPIKHTKGCLTQLSSCTKPVQPNIRCIHLNITSIKHTIHISGPALKLFSYT